LSDVTGCMKTQVTDCTWSSTKWHTRTTACW